MAENKWEPSAEQCDSLERDISRLTGVPYNLGQTMIVAILRRQHEREQILLDALYYARGYGGNHPRLFERANAALAAHAKLNAKPAPTVREAFDAARAKATAWGKFDGSSIVEVPTVEWDALKAAFEREEKGA